LGVGLDFPKSGLLKGTSGLTLNGVWVGNLGLLTQIWVDSTKYLGYCWKFQGWGSGLHLDLHLGSLLTVKLPK
jgi:hypothetical protein